MDFISFLNGFRKFTVMIIVITLACVFRITNHITGQELVSIISPVAVAFMGVNGLEHMTQTIKEWLQAKYKSSNDAQPKEVEDGKA